jgi:hypothetical protein
MTKLPEYRRFNATGTQLTLRLLPPPDSKDDDEGDATENTEHTDPLSHFVTSMNDLFEYALKDCADSDMVGLSISNEEYVQDKAIGLSFRRKDQLTTDAIWNVFQNLTQIRDSTL